MIPGLSSPPAYTLGVLPGDGIGPEVLAQALRVLETLAAVHGFTYHAVEFPWSGRYYLETGQLMPDSALDDFRWLDAILLGAVGDPRCPPGLVERNVIFGLRRGLDLYANVRPVHLYAEWLCPLKNKRPEDIDLVIVRENTEGAYSGIGGTFRPGAPDELALAEIIYSRPATERIIHFAFDLAHRRAAERHRPCKVTLVDKANAIQPMALWTRVFAEIAAEYPDVAQDHAYVDTAALRLVTQPEVFDVIVTSNLFGDILSDIGAAIQGGIGLAASANLHPGRVSLFEPIHGSAPDIAGRGIANPLAAILTVGLMLDTLGQPAAARRLETVIRQLLVTRQILPGQQPTLEIANRVITALQSPISNP